MPQTTSFSASFLSFYIYRCAILEMKKRKRPLGIEADKFSSLLLLTNYLYYTEAVDFSCSIEYLYQTFVEDSQWKFLMESCYYIVQSNTCKTDYVWMMRQGLNRASVFLFLFFFFTFFNVDHTNNNLLHKYKLYVIIAFSKEKTDVKLFVPWCLFLVFYLFIFYLFIYFLVDVFVALQHQIAISY